MVLGHEQLKVDGGKGFHTGVWPLQCPFTFFISMSAAQLSLLPSEFILCQFVYK